MKYYWLRPPQLDYSASNEHLTSQIRPLRCPENQPIRTLEYVFVDILETVRRRSIPIAVLAPLGPPVFNSAISENVLASQFQAALCK